MVDRSPRAAYMPLGETKSFETTLEALGGSYERTLVTHREIYHDFSPPPYRFQELASRGWRLTARPPIQDPEAVLDGDLSTAWSTSGPMKPGDYLELDLGRSTPNLGRVLLFTGNPTDLPGGLRLELSANGRDWQVLREIPRYWNSLFWSGPHPFSRPERGCTELVFPPQTGRFLRVTQTGENPLKAWSVAEIAVYPGLPVGAGTCRCRGAPHSRSDRVPGKDPDPKPPGRALAAGADRALLPGSGCGDGRGPSG